jgi:hypothetical protein
MMGHELATQGVTCHAHSKAKEGGDEMPRLPDGRLDLRRQPAAAAQFARAQ